MRRLIVVFILAFTGRLLAQSGDTLLAPLPIRDQFLLSNGFLFFEPEQARVLDENESQFSLIAADSNTFAKSAWINRSLTGHKERASVQAELSDSRFHLGGPIFLVVGGTPRLELQRRRGCGDNLELGL